LAITIIIGVLFQGCSSGDEIKGYSSKIWAETSIVGPLGDEDVQFYISRVLDGDTFGVTWLPGAEYAGLDMPVRIRGMDAPEKKGRCMREKTLAVDAEKHLNQILNTDKYDMLTFNTILLSEIGVDKFGRMLAKVEVKDWNDDPKSIADIMIEDRYARPYEGGERLGWCDDLGED
jgi:endonuclease YncB( thermonuclease family)